MEKQTGVCLWFTGLSGSGKTTVALAVEAMLKEKGIKVERLDGDVVRQHLTRDLGFSSEDRDENIRRNSFVASLLTRNGIVNLCCFISPYRKAREEARKIVGDHFFEVYVNASLAVCEARDVKGLYAQARAGKIPQFTGISDPYEPPENPEIELRTDREKVQDSAAKIVCFLEKKGYISCSDADLHLHSTASDGQLEPRQLVINAKNSGFAAISVTDHDTTEGLEEALKAGEEKGVMVIPGIELSTLEGEKEVHILGYFIDFANIELQALLSKIKDERKARAEQMVQKLNNLDVNISMTRVREIAGNACIGRPHIARALMEKRYISDMAEAFSADYLGRGGRAYVERFKINPRQAIHLVRGAKGIPVLAHPGLLSDGTDLGEADIARYTAWGLAGLEVYYSKHTLKQVCDYKHIAQKFNLLETGGSDCHGEEKSLLGSVRLPYEFVRRLIAARQQ